MLYLNIIFKRILLPLSPGLLYSKVPLYKYRFSDKVSSPGTVSAMAEVGMPYMLLVISFHFAPLAVPIGKFTSSKEHCRPLSGILE